MRDDYVKDSFVLASAKCHLCGKSARQDEYTGELCEEGYICAGCVRDLYVERLGPEWK